MGNVVKGSAVSIAALMLLFGGAACGQTHEMERAN